MLNANQIAVSVAKWLCFVSDNSPTKSELAFAEQRLATRSVTGLAEGETGFLKRSTPKHNIPNYFSFFHIADN